MDSSTFRLEQIFGSKTRARLLGLFLQHPEQAFYVRELCRMTHCQLNSVRRELKNLVACGIVLEQESEAAQAKTLPKTALSEKKKFYQVNQSFLLYPDLRAFFMKVQILLKTNLVQEIQDKGTVEYFAFTGRFVNAPSIPTDILIVGDIHQKVVQRVVDAFQAELGHEINYTLMPREEFLYRRQITDRFLCTILDQHNVVTVDTLTALLPPSTPVPS